MREKKTAEMKQWENYMLKMQDSHFFDIIRAYTGAIKTPFNKHDLLSRLSSFLKKKDIQENIIEALSYDDIKILTAIYYLKAPSLSTLVYFLYQETKKTVHSQVLNLEERLLIYRVDNSKTNDDTEMLYSINPVLEEALLPNLNIPFIIPYEKKEERIADDSFLPPAFFSIVYSYLYNNPDMFKKEGTLKKKVFSGLLNLCPALEDMPELVHEIFYRLSCLAMLRRDGNEGILIEPQWKAFAELTYLEKLIYLSVGTGFYHNLLDTGLNIAEIFNEFLHILQKGAWYCEKDVYSLFYLIYKKHKGENTGYAFSRREEWFYDTDSFLWNLERVSIEMIHQAERLKLFIRNDEDLLAVNEAIFDIVEEEKPLLISNTFEVTVDQNAKLGSMLPLLPGFKADKLLTLASFEFSRITCEKLFQRNLKADDICTLLEAVSPHGIPQNVKMSIQQWYESYSLVELYAGFVLCVDEKKRKFFQKGAPLASLVKKEISDGVYLLDAEDSKEVDKKLKKVGVDFISFVNDMKFPEYKYTSSALPKVEAPNKTKPMDEIVNETSKRAMLYAKKQSTLFKKLKVSSFDKDIKDVLFHRIERRVIITESQITPDALNNLPKKAEGMDFIGKVKLLEEAKTTRQRVEIVLNNKEMISGNVNDLFKTMQGLQSVEILSDDLSARHRILDISKIQEIRIIIESIFS